MRSFAVPLLFALPACTHFVEVATQRNAAPSFSWPSGVSVTSLTVAVDPEDCDLPPGDRYMWQITGTLTPPIAYGKVPAGARETINSKPLTDACDPYVVTVSNASMQTESRRFSP